MTTVVLYYMRVRTMSSEIFEEYAPSLKSFLVVRHPFERLVSAFENKLINIQNNHDKEWFYKKYIKKIITNYRQKSNNSPQDTDTKSVREVRKETEYEEPTFEEFINYLLDINVQNFDDHWKPISIICHICSFNYDYVLKYEYFQQEIQALIQHFKDTGYLPQRFKIPWDNKVKNRTKTKDRIKKYFRTLSKEKIESLYNIYKTDFLYFDYVFDINDI
ncbi:Carbohydrate sulfotransferase 11 [Armadillidium vulgare]|nr:Carbohydrate sulfotransferase 11 [Armadillidium vulgare]